ncbi:hypothetical protein DFA_02319 [Cavenderia fasciculata]|uniref:Uncharacterized protein n=1 Tax=Cavenderia fasciculata TaxID=261658 RepID=F4PZ46_CACFS|nr:uncharacterized protein DFA_02319 [Cavenderia fasciculata]EGG19075.1 hypothetical protein DFA_02319 [Cavenderia fasciculata]|eukprot:XP_004366708.1 hypothetical protein DFA_02319 [Cavenderia fasciculata]
MNTSSPDFEISFMSLMEPIKAQLRHQTTSNYQLTVTGAGTDNIINFIKNTIGADKLAKPPTRSRSNKHRRYLTDIVIGVQENDDVKNLLLNHSPDFQVQLLGLTRLNVRVTDAAPKRENLVPALKLWTTAEPNFSRMSTSPKGSILTGYYSESELYLEKDKPISTANSKAVATVSVPTTHKQYREKKIEKVTNNIVNHTNKNYNKNRNRNRNGNGNNRNKRPSDEQTLQEEEKVNRAGNNKNVINTPPAVDQSISINVASPALSPIVLHDLPAQTSDSPNPSTIANGPPATAKDPPGTANAPLVIDNTSATPSAATQSPPSTDNSNDESDQSNGSSVTSNVSSSSSEPSVDGIDSPYKPPAPPRVSIAEAKELIKQEKAREALKKKSPIKQVTGSITNYFTHIPRFVKPAAKPTVTTSTTSTTSKSNNNVSKVFDPKVPSTNRTVTGGPKGAPTK